MGDNAFRVGDPQEKASRPDRTGSVATEIFTETRPGSLVFSAWEPG